MPLLTRLDILSAARARIARGWCQHYEALNAQGTPTTPWDAEAVAHCAFGAVLAAMPRDMDGVFSKAASVVRDLMTWRNAPDSLVVALDNITELNDNPHTTQADMLALFDAEIARQLSMEMA